MRCLPYVQYDVFTSRPLEGNQLGIFTDARGLSGEEMQRLAKETNFSETTFIIPRDAVTERERGVQVRIFTVEEELPFAGHPTLGTATYLYRQRGGEQVDLDVKVGKIPVTFKKQPDGRVFGEMRQRDPEFGHVHRAEDIAAIGGLEVSDLRDGLPIQTVSTGLRFCIVPVKTLAALQRLRFNAALAQAYAHHSDVKFFYWLTTETMSPEAQIHARMVFYNGEDPATGSACGCCAAWMARYGIAKSDERVMIEQGIEIRRPSQIYVSAERTGESITNVRVGGYSVEVARGEYLLP